MNLASSPAQLCALCRQRQRQHHLQVTARCPTPAQTSPLNLLMSLRLLDAHAPANLASLLQVSVGRREEWSLPWPSRTGSARPTRRFESPGRPWREDSQVLISECEAHSQLARCRRENTAGGWFGVAVLLRILTSALFGSFRHPRARRTGPAHAAPARVPAWMVGRGSWVVGNNLASFFLIISANLY